MATFQLVCGLNRIDQKLDVFINVSRLEVGALRGKSHGKACIDRVQQSAVVHFLAADELTNFGRYRFFIRLVDESAWVFAAIASLR